MFSLSNRGKKQILLKDGTGKRDYEAIEFKLVEKLIFNLVCSLLLSPPVECQEQIGCN